MTAPLVVFLALAAAAFAAIVRIVLGAARGGGDGGPAAQTYARARLAELEAEAAAGVVSAADAAAERRALERLLGGATPRPVEAEEAPGRAAALAVLAAAVLLAVGIWLALGRPDLMTAPSASSRPHAADVAGGKEYAELVDRLARVLEDHPERVDGWKLLARSRLDQGRAIDAFRAAERGLARAPDDPDLLLLAAEALVAQAEGRVTPAAELALEKLAAIRPDHPAPRYYRGLALLQADRADEALDIWRDLAASLKADDPFRGRLMREITRVEMIAAMRSGDPEAAIAGMVERLRARLAEDPADADGWAMLARSYEVLGRPADAIAALERLRSLVSGATRAAVEADIARLQRMAGGAAPDAERKDGS